MSLVRIKGKYQITIPQALRKQLNLELGDFLEVQAEGDKLTFVPKKLVDREIHVPSATPQRAS